MPSRLSYLAFFLLITCKLPLAPNGKTVVAVQYRNRGVFHDCSLQLYEIPTGKLFRTIPLANNMVHRLFFTPDSKYLCYWGVSSSAVYEVATGKKCYTSSGEVNYIHFSPTGKYLVSTSNTVIQVIDTAKWKVHWQASGKQFDHFTFAKNGQLLAATDATKIRLWRFADGREQFNSINNPGSRTLLQSCPNGQLLAAAPNAGVATPVLLDIDSGALVHKCKIAKSQRNGNVPSIFLPAGLTKRLMFSRDGRTLFGWGADRFIFVWDVATGKERLRLDGHHRPVQNAELLPDGRTLVSKSIDNMVLIWDVTGLRTHPKQYKKTLTRDDLVKLWESLKSDDARTSHKVIWQMIAVPKETVAFLQEHLHLVPKQKELALKKEITSLNHPRFKIRQRAFQKLEQLGKQASPALRAALAKNPSFDLSVQLRRLLSKLAKQPLDDGLLQQIRAVEVLEQIGNREARLLLQQLASGASGFRLTEDAQLAVIRLKARNKTQK